MSNNEETYWIKVDSDNNVVNHPEPESNLVVALGYRFNKNNEFVKFKNHSEIDLGDNQLIQTIPDPVTFTYHEEDGGYFTQDVEARELTQKEKTDKFIRQYRNFELTRTDWKVLPDSPLSAEDLQIMIDYRTALRNLPALYPEVNSISDVEFPPIPDAPSVPEE